LDVFWSLPISVFFTSLSMLHESLEDNLPRR
jgi:hypothetical protein